LQFRTVVIAKPRRKCSTVIRAGIRRKYSVNSRNQGIILSRYKRVTRRKFSAAKQKEPEENTMLQ
jgi:hypothetical protein